MRKAFSISVLCLIVVLMFTACGGGGGGGGTGATAPKAPTGLTANATSSGSIDLAWTDSSDNEESFKIERGTDGTTFTEIGTTTANTASHSDTGLTASTKYYYRVRASNGTGDSDYSNIADATTQAPPVTAPAAPSGLTATTASSTTINLSWTDNSDNEEGFRIERGTDGTTFTGIGTTAANTAIYSDTDCNASTKYYYRVRAYNSAGNSTYSNTATATTQAPPVTAPAPPTGLVISSSTSTTITLSWTDNSGNEDGFKIEKSNDGTTFSQLGTVSANITIYSDTGLTPNTTYYYRVRAYNIAGNSAYSNTANDTTDIILGSVAALYPANGANWNDYVKASDTATACAGTETGGYSACIHGGEKKAVQVTGKTSCTGLTAQDALGIFDWTCDGSTNPVQMVSTGLKDGKNLSDLIDFTTPAWKQNAVTVSDGGTVYLATGSSTWWTNPIVADNDGLAAGQAVAGNIYIVNAASPTATYVIDQSKVGLVIKPGVTLQGTATTGETIISASSVNFFWIEGSIDIIGDNLGVLLTSVKFSSLRNIETNNANAGTYQAGIALSASSNNRLSKLTGINNGSYGISIGSLSNNNTFTNIAMSRNGNRGVEIGASRNNDFMNVTTSNNYTTGLYLVNTSDSNTFRNILASNNGTFGVEVDTSSNNKLIGITSMSNGNSGIGYGVYLGGFSNNNTIVNITASNNGDQGIAVGVSSNNMLASITASNNRYGINLEGSYTTLSNISVYSNSTNGVRTYNSENDKFSGQFKLGYNALDCYVSGGVNPGLDDDADPSDVTTDSVHSGLCTQQGASDFGTAITGITLASSFVGKVTTNDTVNASDTNGTADYASITDWVNFENTYRGWGKDGSAFPNTDNQGQCTTGTCRIWDWSLASGDAVIRNVLSLPTGTNTLTHVWYAASTPASQADCDTAAPGSIFNTDHCENTFLRNAVEITDDGIGNENGLCESNETCLFTPNIGSYQGHGNLVSAGAFTDGTITGVTLMKYETNGR